MLFRAFHAQILVEHLSLQQAAGTLSYLRTTVLNDFILPTDAEEIPLDLTQPFVYMLEWLMLAQAQECFWQKAKLGGSI